MAVMKERQYGFGIVGCGVIAGAHARAIAGLPNAHLVAVTDVVASRAEALAGAHGAELEPDLAALLRRPEVDVVAVCVPSGLHAEVATTAAQAGKHLVVEKPIDVSLVAADGLLAAVDDAGVGLTVVCQRRFDPGYRALADLIDQGRLGRLIVGDARVKWFRDQAYYDSEPWRGTWAMDGGALMNQGIHYVDLLRWFMGPVVEVTAICATQAHRIEVEDVALALLRFESGAVGTLEVSTAIYPGLPERVEVTGTGGTVVVESGRTRARELADAGGEVSSHGKPIVDMFRDDPEPDAPYHGAVGDSAHAAQIADFLGSLDDKREPLITGQDGRDDLEVVLAVYRSARTGAPVTLPLSL